MNHPEDLREDEEARRKRLGLKPDESDIDRRILAMKVLGGAPLDRHEQLLIARLLDPGLVAALTKKKKGQGRSPSNATAVRADRIAQYYFMAKATHPHAKHKKYLLPYVAKRFRVSPSYVDKILRKLDPTRRAEFKSDAALLVQQLAEYIASPEGIAERAEWENAVKRRRCEARNGSPDAKALLRALNIKMR